MSESHKRQYIEYLKTESSKPYNIIDDINEILKESNDDVKYKSSKQLTNFELQQYKYNGYGK